MSVVARRLTPTYLCVAVSPLERTDPRGSVSDSVWFYTQWAAAGLGELT